MPYYHLVAAVGFVVLVLIFKGVKLVPQADNWIVERFGKYSETLKPGLNLINPLFSKIVQKVDIREQVLDLPKQGIITADNAQVQVDGVVFYKVMDPYKSFYGIKDLRWASQNLAQTTLRSIMGKMTLDGSLSSRDTINQELLQVLDEATDAWGTKVTRVELKDIEPPADIADAMTKQMKAERERRARVLEAEGISESAEKEAEGRKQAAILEAEGEKQSAILRAEARERSAQAEANALTMVSESLTQSNGDPTLYLLGQEYVKSLTKLGDSQNSKFLVLPADLMSTITNLFGKKV